MKLKAIIAELTGAEINKKRLQDKAGELKKQQDIIKDKIQSQSDKIKRQKILHKYSKEIKKQINEEGNISQILRTNSGKVIALVYQTGSETRYFDRNRRLIAFENRNGTFNQFGTKVSPDAIGLFLVGLKAK
jgi:hypothetical protein